MNRTPVKRCIGRSAGCSVNTVFPSGCCQASNPSPAVLDDNGKSNSTWNTTLAPKCSDNSYKITNNSRLLQTSYQPQCMPTTRGNVTIEWNVTPQADDIKKQNIPPAQREGEASSRGFMLQKCLIGDDNFHTNDFLNGDNSLQHVNTRRTEDGGIEYSPIRRRSPCEDITELLESRSRQGSSSSRHRCSRSGYKKDDQTSRCGPVICVQALRSQSDIIHSPESYDGKSSYSRQNRSCVKKRSAASESPARRSNSDQRLTNLAGESPELRTGRNINGGRQWLDDNLPVPLPDNAQLQSYTSDGPLVFDDYEPHRRKMSTRNNSWTSEPCFRKGSENQRRSAKQTAWRPLMMERLNSEDSTLTKEDQLPNAVFRPSCCDNSTMWTNDYRSTNIQQYPRMNIGVNASECEQCKYNGSTVPMPNNNTEAGQDINSRYLPQRCSRSPGISTNMIGKDCRPTKYARQTASMGDDSDLKGRLWSPHYCLDENTATPNRCSHPTDKAYKSTKSCCKCNDADARSNSEYRPVSMHYASFNNEDERRAINDSLDHMSSDNTYKTLRWVHSNPCPSNDGIEFHYLNRKTGERFSVYDDASQQPKENLVRWVRRHR